jgi:hypothetical protein
MAMNKKEQAEMEALKHELRVARAMRFTDPVPKDVFPPQTMHELVTGWVYNAHSKRVDVACTNSVNHAVGQTDRTTSQRPILMYSSRLLALKGLRHELERKYAEELAELDRKIEDESREQQ